MVAREVDLEEVQIQDKADQEMKVLEGKVLLNKALLRALEGKVLLKDLQADILEDLEDLHSMDHQEADQEMVQADSHEELQEALQELVDSVDAECLDFF